MPDVAYNLRRRLQWFLLLRVGLTTCLLAATVFLYYRHGGDNTPAGERLLSQPDCRCAYCSHRQITNSSRKFRFH